MLTGRKAHERTGGELYSRYGVGKGYHAQSAQHSSLTSNTGHHLTLWHLMSHPHDNTHYHVPRFYHNRKLRDVKRARLSCRWSRWIQDSYPLCSSVACLHRTVECSRVRRPAYTVQTYCIRSTNGSHTVDTAPLAVTDTKRSPACPRRRQTFHASQVSIF